MIFENSTLRTSSDGRTNINPNSKHKNIRKCIPLIPNFYIAKLGYAGVYLFFLFFAQKPRLWVLVRTSSARRFKRVPTIYILSKNKKKYIKKNSENCQFLQHNTCAYFHNEVIGLNFIEISFAG